MGYKYKKPTLNKKIRNMHFNISEANIINRTLIVFSTNNIKGVTSTVHNWGCFIVTIRW